MAKDKAEKPRLSQRRLRAMDAALGAMLSGEDGTGDWPPEVTREDLEAAQAWVQSRIKS